MVSPPKDYEKWDDLMTHFAQHLVDRYGIDEVAQVVLRSVERAEHRFLERRFRSRQRTSSLYDHTARALKAVNARVAGRRTGDRGGPWIPDFLKHTSENNVPVDFVSTHGYADDTVQDMFGTNEDIPMDQRVCRAIEEGARRDQGLVACPTCR